VTVRQSLIKDIHHSYLKQENAKVTGGASSHKLLCAAVSFSFFDVYSSRQQQKLLLWLSQWTVSLTPIKKVSALLINRNVLGYFDALCKIGKQLLADDAFVQRRDMIATPESRRSFPSHGFSTGV
jgi:hypothetical protein